SRGRTAWGRPPWYGDRIVLQPGRVGELRYRRGAGVPTAGQRVGADGVQTTLTSVASRAAAVSGAGRVAVVPGDAEGTGASWITTSAPGSTWPSVSRSVPR